MDEQAFFFRKLIKIILAILLFALSVYYCWLFLKKIDITTGIWQFNLIIILSSLIAFFLIWAIVKVLKALTISKYNDYLTKSNLKRGLSDFIIGDEGGYSLSRFQAVLWATVIIAYQISVLLTLILKDRSSKLLFYYELNFSEPVIFLLGLSLMSCITVKGITVDKLNKKPILKTRKYYRKPKPLDLIIGENGLDFSKCQMLIWTIIAIIVFNSKVYEFDKALYKTNEIELTTFFQNQYDEYSYVPNAPNNKLHDVDHPFVPYLPYTFIVLMGLSQGAYIGKKLVPSFKFDDIKKANEDKVSFLMEKLLIKKELFAQTLLTTSKNAVTPTDLENIKNLQVEIEALETQINELNNQIDQINKVNII